MVSTVKSRRLMSMQAKKEKEEMDRQNKGRRHLKWKSALLEAQPSGFSLAERMEKEAEEERIRRQKASAERAFQEGVTKARLVLRRTPLGTDRNHNRWELRAVI